MARLRSRPPSSPGRAALKPRVKVWFETDGGFSFGTGLVAILQAVDHCGSIKQAAAEIGQSYRHVWGRIKRAEDALGEPLVESQVGGQGHQRSVLTDRARQIIADFLATRSRMIAAMDEELARRSSGLK